jgi:ferritin-like metal-binding protein YciE
MALKDVLIDELRDMYSAENQLVKALPKLAKGAKNSDLKTLFTDHLKETKDQVERLKSVFATLNVQPTGEHCKGMEGIIKEGADALEKDEDGASFDSGIIGAAIRTEHYEIAGYTAIIAMANTLKMSGVVALLQQSLKEEENATKKVISVSQAILKESAGEPESRKGPKSEKEKYSDKKSKEDEKNAAPAMAKHSA